MVIFYKQTEEIFRPLTLIPTESNIYYYNASHYQIMKLNECISNFKEQAHINVNDLLPQYSDEETVKYSFYTIIETSIDSDLFEIVLNSL
jgi:hypothetical protein